MIETVVEYENGGRIDVYRMVDKSAGDFKNVFACCDYFARQGKRAVIMPKVHYKDSLYKEIYSQLDAKYGGKCPDFSVNGIFYEHEGFDAGKNTNVKRTFKNMISRGEKQSNFIVINDCGVGHVWAQRNIYDRVRNGSDIKEVWILNNTGQLARLC